MRVITLTLNPAFDLSTSVERVAANRKLRCETPRHEPGGGGINISAALQELDCPSQAMFLAGGPQGAMLQHLLDTRGMNQIPVKISGWTRCNLAVFDHSTQEQYRFVMPGPQVSADEVRTCFTRLIDLDPTPDYVAASGSLPPGMPADMLRELARTVRDLGARLVVDTSGAPLKMAADEGVYLLKPNMSELRELSQMDVSTEPGQENAMRRLVNQGACEVGVLSLGAAGVLLTTEDMQERLRAPAVPIASRVGAGDSMVAGILVGLSRGYEIRDAVRLGIAAGSAAVMTPGTSLCRRDDVWRLYQQEGNQKRPAPVNSAKE